MALFDLRLRINAVRICLYVRLTLFLLLAADRAAAAIGAVSNGSCPAVSTGPAHPAHLLHRPGQDLFRSQRLIPLIIPFCSQGGMDCGQAVFPAGQPANTIGAATTIHPGVRRCLPFVSLFTAPPNLFIGVRQVGAGRQRIACGMPLSCERRRCGFQRDALAGAHCTLRTSTPLFAVGYTGLPLMPLFTAPPNLLPAGRGNLPRGERGVFLWMPLLNQIGTDRGKAVLRRHPPAGAVGAVLATDTALIDLSFPFMSPFTAPPDVF